MYMSPLLSPTFNSLHAEGAQYIRTDSGRSAFMRTPLLESAQIPFGISLGYRTMARRLYTHFLICMGIKDHYVSTSHIE